MAAGQRQGHSSKQKRSTRAQGRSGEEEEEEGKEMMLESSPPSLWSRPTLIRSSRFRRSCRFRQLVRPPRCVVSGRGVDGRERAAGGSVASRGFYSVAAFKEAFCTQRRASSSVPVMADAPIGLFSLLVARTAAAHSDTRDPTQSSMAVQASSRPATQARFVA